MQHLDEELPILEILRVVRGVFSSLPPGEAWLPGYIQGNLQHLLKPNDPGLGLLKTPNGIISNKSHLSGLVHEEPEPVPEEPEPVPEEPEPVPEEPEPVPEEPEPVPEETEPVPEGLSIDSDGRLWTIPRVPAEVDDWPRASSLRGATPNAEILQESIDQGHITRISCSDLTLSRGLPVPSETGFISIVAV
ncbi:hypothetical protein DTO012A7_8151 [Penicillium roqueforti]|nr:hypothetical protein DTO012A7_8151 [Penicillium roqueforti]